ncbi:hypothetical protein [Sphingobacterium cellulitidis]|uniref:hypothetical protein n=1 Tax=Sphingobacterium cellulitidis TaxID=1768011 RepID=UPI000B9F7978|nr:hypothetical protein CHT99_15705 [Sphingobacterium cellulitidis]
MRTTETKSKSIKTITQSSQIESILKSIESLKRVMDLLCDLPDYLVAEEFNSEIFDTICELYAVNALIKTPSFSKAA